MELVNYPRKRVKRFTINELDPRIIITGTSSDERVLMRDGVETSSKKMGRNPEKPK